MQVPAYYKSPRSKGCSLENSLPPKIFIDPVTIFCESPVTKMHLECGATKLHAYKMVDTVHVLYMKREHTKHTLKTRYSR